MNAWEKFKKTVEINNLIENGDKVLAAVSGGPDSICLLHLLWRLKKNKRIELFAVSMDHGLRKQSKKEAELTASFGQKLNIPVFIEKIAVKNFSEEHKISLETAGRTLRYNTLMALAKKLKCNKIATGHTANDNAETILMWLIRGTGSEGLSGIPVKRLAEDKKNIIRPISALTRSEIMQYLKSQSLSYSIDKSNFSMDFTRNRIRHKIVPVMEKFNPRFIEHLFNLSGIISQENEFIDTIVLNKMKTSVKVSENKILLDLKRFFGYNTVIQSRILKKILPEKCSLLHIERLREWLYKESITEMDFSSLWRVKKSKDKLIFEKRVKN